MSLIRSHNIKFQLGLRDAWQNKTCINVLFHVWVLYLDEVVDVGLQW